MFDGCEVIFVGLFVDIKKLLLSNAVSDSLVEIVTN